MWILVRVDDSLLAKVLNYLTNLKIWFRKFEEKEYNSEISAEDRLSRIQHTRQGSMNPPVAWKTCGSLKQIWDWDPRGPSARYKGDRGPDPAPWGKGWITAANGSRQRVAGECANPTMLHFISCPQWCPSYTPATVAGRTWLMEQAAEEHEARAGVLRRQVIHLRESEVQYQESIKK